MNIKTPFTMEPNDLNAACIADKLRLINGVVSSIYDDALRPIGITLNQLNIIVVVAMFEPASPGKVGEWLQMKKSTVSRNIDLMSKNGWLQIKPLGKGQSLEITLSSEGIAMLNKGTPLWEGAQSIVYGMIRKQSLEEIKKVADEMRRSSL